MKKHILLVMFVYTTNALANQGLKITLDLDAQTPLSLNISDTPVADENLTVRSAPTSSIVTPAFQNAIHNEDMATSDTTPLYTIQTSGRYYLANDIFARRTTTTTGVVFSITANNVVLNLNSKTIAPHVSSAHTGATAIQVTGGLSNTQILNGTIQGADSNGTQRFAKGVEVLSTSSINKVVKLRNLHVTRLRDVSGTCTGLELNGINDLLLDDCNVNDCTISSASGTKILYGISLNTVNNFALNGCECNNNVATSSDAASTVNGLRLATCVNGTVENVIASNNQSVAGGALAATTYGIIASACSTINFKNSTASSNKGTSGTTGAVSGFYFTTAPLCNLTDCYANNNQDATTACTPSGIYIGSNSDCCTLTRCNAEQNNSALSSSSVYGIRVESAKNTLVDCHANANSSGSSTGYGIYLSGSHENTLNNCSANYNQGSATCYGIFALSSNNNGFLNCHANGNQSTANSGSCSGFYSNGGANNIFESCVANGNDTYPDSNETGTTAAGFRLASSEARAQLINCRAVGNRGGTTSSFAYGIYLESASASTVKNCYLAYNNVANGAAFGYADDSSTSSTVLINNTAAGQGQCLGTTLDASIQWGANTKPTTTNQNYWWKHPGTGDDVRNAIAEAPILSFLSISTTVGDWTNISLY